jgi:hypothetical protein
LLVVNHAAHSAFDFEEFADGIRKSYYDCKFVEYVDKFGNFSSTIQRFLNVAADTLGADHFNEYRYR